MIFVFLYFFKKIYKIIFYYSEKQSNNKANNIVVSQSQQKIINHFLIYKNICIINFLYCENYFDYLYFFQTNVIGLEKSSKFYIFKRKPFIYIKIKYSKYFGWAIFVHLCNTKDMQNYYNTFVNNTNGKINFVLILIDNEKQNFYTFVFNKFHYKCKKYNSYSLKKILYYIDLININY